jgi:hypothetical protein
MNAGTTVQPPPDRTDAAPATISSASLDSGKYGGKKSMLAVGFCWGAFLSSTIDRGAPCSYFGVCLIRSSFFARSLPASFDQREPGGETGEGACHSVPGIYLILCMSEMK